MKTEIQNFQKKPKLYESRNQRARRIRQAVTNIILIRKNQIKNIEDNLIKPLKDNINFYNDFLKGKQSFQNVEKHSLMINRQLSELLRIEEDKLNSCLNNKN